MGMPLKNLAQCLRHPQKMFIYMIIVIPIVRQLFNPFFSDSLQTNRFNKKRFSPKSVCHPLILDLCFVNSKASKPSTIALVCALDSYLSKARKGARCRGC